MAGNTAAEATELTTLISTYGGGQYIQAVTPSAVFSFDGTGNQQWVKFRLFSGVSASLNTAVSAFNSATSAFDISLYGSTSDTEDGSTLNNLYNGYEGSAGGFANFFNGLLLTGGAQWVFVKIDQNPYSPDPPYDAIPPAVEQFSLSFTNLINGMNIVFGGYSSDYTTYVPYGFSQGWPLASTTTVGITSIAPIASTSSVQIKSAAASDDIHDAPDISKGGTVTTGVDGAAWNIGTQQSNEPSITAFGINWIDTSWHKYDLLVAGSVRFYDDPALADLATGYAGLAGTLIAVYSGPADADYDELTLLGTNLTLNSAGTGYTAADLTVTLTAPTWLYIEHAFVGDLLSDHGVYPDQSLSWTGPAVSGGGGGGDGGGGTTTTDTDDGLFLFGATMFGGDVTETTTTIAVDSSPDNALFGDWGFGITMLGGDAPTTTDTGGGGGGGTTPTKLRLAGEIFGSTLITASLTLPSPTPRLITFNAEVLSRAGTKQRAVLVADDAINAQPVHFFT